MTPEQVAELALKAGRYRRERDEALARYEAALSSVHYALGLRLYGNHAGETWERWQADATALLAADREYRQRPEEPTA